MSFTDSVENNFSDRHTKEEIFVVKNKTFESVSVGTQHHYLLQYIGSYDIFFVKKKKNRYYIFVNISTTIMYF